MMGLFSRLGGLLNAIKVGTSYVLQTPITATQAAAVQNQWYTALPTSYLGRLIDVSIDAAGGCTMEVRITIDGQAIAGAGVVTPATHLHVVIHMHADEAVLEFVTTANKDEVPFLIEGRTVLVEYRQTSEAGGEDLLCGVLYAIKT